MWAKAVLALTYALQFNQRMRQASALPGTKLYALVNQGDDATPAISEPPLRGGADIILSYALDAYPVKQILHQVMLLSGLGQPFEYIAPTLQRLVTEELPWITSFYQLFCSLRRNSIDFTL